MKTKTAFQSVLAEAQPSLRERGATAAVRVAEGTVEAIGVGFSATINLLVAGVGLYCSAIDWVYDVSHNRNPW